MKSLHQLIVPQRYHQAHQTAFVRFQQTGQGDLINKTLELKACHKNGHEIFVELSLSSLHLRDSKTAAVIKQYPTGHERILLVDDEEPIVLLEQMMLERLGYQVTIRMSSPDALAAFKDNPGNFDLVISGRGMPNMTGEQLAAELISIRPGIPIILCTGFCNDNDVKRAKAMGVKGFLMKPVAIGDLAEMVRKVLDEASHSAHWLLNGSEGNWNP